MCKLSRVFISLLFMSKLAVADNCTNNYLGKNKATCDDALISCSELPEKTIESLYLHFLTELEKIKDVNKELLYIDEEVKCPRIKSLLKVNLAKKHSELNLLKLSSFTNDMKLIKKNDFKILILSNLANTFLNRGNKIEAKKYADQAYKITRINIPKTKILYSSIFILSKVYAKLGEINNAYLAAEVIEGAEKQILIEQVDSILLNPEKVPNNP